MTLIPAGLWQGLNSNSSLLLRFLVVHAPVIIDVCACVVEPQVLLTQVCKHATPVCHNLSLMTWHATPIDQAHVLCSGMSYMCCRQPE